MRKSKPAKLCITLLTIIAVTIFSIKVGVYFSSTHQREMEALSHSIEYQKAEFAALQDGLVEYLQVPYDTPYMSNLVSYLPYTVPSNRTYTSDHDWIYRIQFHDEAETVLMIDEHGLMNVNGTYIVMSDENWVDMCHKFEVAYLNIKHDYASEILTCPIEAYS